MKPTTTTSPKRTVFLSFAITAFAVFAARSSLASDWVSAAKPKFPPDALKKGSEGNVRLRIMLNRDGTVKDSAITKTSGDAALDHAAQEAVLKWKMKPEAIRPVDLTKGRQTIIEFQQQAAVAAVYPDRKAYFEDWEHTDAWMYAPFPSYPRSERALHHSGTVWLYGEISPDGRVKNVKILQSCGYPVLDQCAAAALRLWQAHKQYAGQQFKMPVRFQITR